MKKFLFFILIIPNILFSQNYIITPIDQNPVGNPGDLLLAPVLVTNNTNNPIDFMYNRIYLNIPTGWVSCVCLPVCMPPGPKMTYSFTIQANSTETVMPNFQTDSIAGIGYSRFIFTEIGSNINDTLDFSGTTLSMAGIKENKLNAENFKVFPNPTSDFVIIENTNTKQIKEIKIFSAEGKEVKSLEYINAKQNRVDLKGLGQGNYSVTVIATDGKRFSYKIVKPY